MLSFEDKLLPMTLSLYAERRPFEWVIQDAVMGTKDTSKNKSAEVFVCCFENRLAFSDNNMGTVKKRQYNNRVVKQVFSNTKCKTFSNTIWDTGSKIYFGTNMINVSFKCEFWIKPYTQVFNLINSVQISTILTLYHKTDSFCLRLLYQIPLYRILINWAVVC